MNKNQLIGIFIKSNLAGIVASIFGYALAPHGLLFTVGIVWVFIVINAGLISGIVQLRRDNMERYKCWDCEKEVKNVNFDDERKKKCPRTMDGFLLIICKDCIDNEDEDI